jgi:hypothetical protein
VRRVCRVKRAADGTFIAIGEPAPEVLWWRGHVTGIGLATIIRSRRTGSCDRRDH